MDFIRSLDPNKISQKAKVVWFPGWLRRIALWRCQYYTAKRVPSESIEELIERLPAEGDAESALERGQLMDQVRQILWQLPRHHREILILHYLDQYSHREIAGFLDLTEGAVRKRLHDARRRTRRLYDRWLRAAIGSIKSADKDWRKRMVLKARDEDGRTAQDIIDGMIRPDWCLKTEEGRLAWDLFCAAIRNDVDTLGRHLKDDPECVQLEFWYTPPIHFAVREGNLEATKILWAAHQHDEVSKLIQLAEDRGHTAVVEFLRNEIGALAAVSDLRLHEAIEIEDAEEVRRLLVDAPELAQQQDRRGRTPLHLAVIRGDTESTEALLAAGAQVDAVDHPGFRPIHYAYWGSAYWSKRENPEKLADPLYKAGARDTATLASARGDLDAVRTFVEADRAQVNDPDTLQKRPLSAAVERGHRKIARYLLDEGADPALRETRLCPNGSALMAAAVQDDLEMAGWLLEAGADPNGYIDSSGWPAGQAETDAMRGLLYGHGGKPRPAWDFLHGGHLETVAAILNYCDDPFTGEEKEYLSVPYTAIVSGCGLKLAKGEPTDAHESMLKMFLHRKHPMPTVLTECKQYLYHVPEMTGQLLAQGLDPNLPDWQRRTPLHDLCSHKNAGHARELVEIFLDHGANLEALDEEGRSTPLGLAARCGHLEVVDFLLNRGADPNGGSAGWAKPLAWAERRGHEQVAERLRKAGAREEGAIG